MVVQLYLSNPVFQELSPLGSDVLLLISRTFGWSEKVGRNSFDFPGYFQSQWRISHLSVTTYLADRSFTEQHCWFQLTPASCRCSSTPSAQRRSQIFRHERPRHMCRMCPWAILFSYFMLDVSTPALNNQTVTCAGSDCRSLPVSSAEVHQHYPAGFTLGIV